MHEFHLAKKSLGLDGLASNDPLISKEKIHTISFLLFLREEPKEKRDNGKQAGAVEVQWYYRWSF